MLNCHKHNLRKAFIDGLIKKDENAASSKKGILVSKLEWKNMPFLWQNDQNRYPIYEQNGWKTTPFGAAHTYKKASPPGEKNKQDRKNAIESIETKSKRVRDWNESWLSDHTYTICSLWYSSTWNILTFMNIMLLLMSKSRTGFLMFQRVKSSQLEEVKKSLNKLETRNDNVVSKLARNKKVHEQKK